MDHEAQEEDQCLQVYALPRCVLSVEAHQARMHPQCRQSLENSCGSSVALGQDERDLSAQNVVTHQSVHSPLLEGRSDSHLGTNSVIF